MAKALVFHNLSLFDGVTPQVRPDTWIEVANGHIQRMDVGPWPAADSTVDLGGRTVIPGLIDAHVHILALFASLTDPSSLVWRAQQFRLNLANCIRSGVTTVRDLGGTPGLLRQLRRWIQEGKVVGPRIVCANSFIAPPGGYPEFLPAFPFPLRFIMGGQIVERASTPDQVREQVRRMVDLGADWIKTAYADRSFFVDRPAPSAGEDAWYEALVDEARKLDRPVAIHQLWASGFRKAIELGVDSIEHMPLDALTGDDIRRLVDSDTPILPTLKVTQDFLSLEQIASLLDREGETYLCPKPLIYTQEQLARFQNGITPEIAQREYYMDIAMLERQVPAVTDNVRKLYEAGAVIGCGTDSGGTTFALFGQIDQEIDHLVKVGLSPFEALRSATSVNARILHLEDQLGTLEPGKLADWVVLDGNPLEDIQALRQVRMTVKEGAIVHRDGM